MVLSSRERYISIGVGIAVAALVFDRFAVTPYLGRRDRAQALRASLENEVAQGKLLLGRRGELDARWGEMAAGGLKRDAGEAESAVLHAIREYAQEAGLSLTSVRQDRAPARKSAAQQVAFQAVGVGPMAAVARFLWRLESSALPVNIEEMQLSARREGTDDLSVQLRLSTLYFAAEGKGAVAEKAKPAGGGSGG